MRSVVSKKNILWLNSIVFKGLQDFSHRTLGQQCLIIYASKVALSYRKEVMGKDICQAEGFWRFCQN